jgi:hypothetical protein
MRNLTCVLVCALSLTAIGCSDDEIDSDEQARRAYLGLDKSLQKSIDLGFQGFNAASSANIDPQMTTGAKAGTMTVSGQVDQGNSPSNKGMRLYIGMVGYTDGPFDINADHDQIEVIYDTDTAQANQPFVSLKLSGIPTGTVDGTLTSNSMMTGVYKLSGAIEGTLTLNLMIMGTLMAGTGTQAVVRVPGATTVTGTATNADGGVYNISITI